MRWVERRLEGPHFGLQARFFVDRKAFRLSGFVCIVHGDSAPIERAFLQSLTDFLSFRGPDGQDIWLDHSVGMGHALLRTTYESKNEKQPLDLEERYWIAADARLDAREELIAELRHKEDAAHFSAPD